MPSLLQLKLVGVSDQIIFEQYKNLDRQLLSYQEKLNLSMSGNTKMDYQGMKAALQVNRQKLMDSLVRIYETFIKNILGAQFLFTSWKTF